MTKFTLCGFPMHTSALILSLFTRLLVILFNPMAKVITWKFSTIFLNFILIKSTNLNHSKMCGWFWLIWADYLIFHRRKLVKGLRLLIVEFCEWYFAFVMFFSEALRWASRKVNYQHICCYLDNIWVCPNVLPNFSVCVI